MATAGVSGFLRRVRQSAAAGALAPLPDHDLLARFLARGDDAAFLAVLHRHGPMVYRVCRRALRREQDAEDAFQATFLVLARKARTIRKRASLAGWLHGTAHRVALKLRDSARRRKDREERTAGPSAGERDEADWAEVRAILDDELQRLPDRLRDPLVLCYLEGRTQDEAAEQLGWSKSTVRRRLESARTVLGRRLTGRGVTLAAALAGPLLSDCAASAMSPTLACQTADGAVQVLAGAQAAAAFPAPVAALADAAIRSGAYAKSTMVSVLLVASVAGGWATLPGGDDYTTIRTVSQTQPMGGPVGVPQRGGDDVRNSTRAALTTAAMLTSGVAAAQEPRPVQPPVPVPTIIAASPQGALRVVVAAPTRPSGGSLIMRRAVMDDLALDKDQRAQLGAVWQAIQEEYAEEIEIADAAKESKDPREILGGHRARIKVEHATAEALDKVLPDVLSEGQQKRLGQIQLQVMQVHAFGEPEVQEALRLTDAQKKKYEALVRATLEGVRATAVQAVRPPLPAPGEPAVPAVRPPLPAPGEPVATRAVVRSTVDARASRDKFLEILTDAQKQAWKELIGKPFVEVRATGVGRGVRVKDD